VLSENNYLVLSEFQSKSLKAPIEGLDRKRIEFLLSQGFLRTERNNYRRAENTSIVWSRSDEWITIEPEGIDALASCDKMLEKQREDGRKERYNNHQVWAVAIVSCVLSTFLTLVIEHVIIPIIEH